MPVSSPAYKSLCFTSDGRGVALSLQKGVIKIDSLLRDVKAFDNHLVTLILKPDVPLLIRPLLLPLKSSAEIDQALPHEVEGLFSTQQGEVAFDRILHPLEKGKRRVTLLLTNQSGLQETIKPFEELGILNEVVTAAPVCLATAAFHISPSLVPRGVLLADKDYPYFIVEKGGALLASAKLSYPLQKGNLSRAIGSLTRELQTPLAKDILFFSSGETVESPQPHTLVPPPACFGLTEEEWSIFVLPFGGAIGSLVGTLSGINLREKLLTAPLPWKRATPSLLKLGGAFTLALVALFLAGLSYISWKEDLLKEKWAYTLSLLGKSEEVFEDNFIEKGGGVPKALLSLTPSEIVSRAQFVQKELASTPILFPLHPNTPRVTDLLAWLSTLNEVVGEEGRLQMTSFQYTLLKRPEMEKKQEKYQIKVDLDFTTSSPKWAREFHDLLINPNPFVDPKGEVKWNVTRGSYKTSFLLKDQTAYVH